MVLKVNRPSVDMAATKQSEETGGEIIEQTAQAQAQPEPEVEVVNSPEPEVTGEVVDEEAEAPSGTVEEAAETAQASTTANSDAPREVATRNESSQQVAQATGSTTSTENFFQKMLEDLKKEGQDGLELGFGVFPVIALDKGEFKIGDEDLDDQPFAVVPLSSTPKYAYRTTGIPDKEVEVAFADSDREHLDPNSAVSAKLLEWKEKWENSGFEIKKYQNVFCYVTDMPAKPDLVGQIALLSVSPQSVKRYTNACIAVKGRGYAAHECVFQVGVGEKIRGDFDYYPWDFKALGSCKKLGVEVKFGGVRDEDF